MSIATRPPEAPAPAPVREPSGQSVLWLVIGGWLSLLGSIIKIAFKSVDVVLSGLLWTLTGRARHLFAPLWLLGLAIASTLAPVTAWAWIAAAMWLHARPAKSERRFRLKLSTRERALVAKVAAVVALVVDCGLPIGWSGGLLGATVIVASVPWLKGRWVRKVKRPEILDRWENEVVAVESKFAGEWVDFDAATLSGTWRSEKMLGSELAKLDAEAERLLDQAAGTVTIAYDPRLSRRLVRVTFTQPGDAARFRFCDGPSLQRDGRFIMLMTPSGDSIHGRFWQKNGRACHILIAAPTSSGKGGASRHLVREAAPSPLIGVVGICGKKGSGLGYLQSGYLHLAERVDDWRRTAEAFEAIMDERSERFGAVQADSFIPTAEDPYLFLHIGELPQVIPVFPGIKRIIKRITEIGGSLGIGVWVEVQKADAPSIGSTDARSNILDGGWVWAGPATEQQARLALKQGYDFDPMALPQEPGWAAVMGRIFGGQPITPGRQLWTPNRRDVLKAPGDLGISEEEAAPFGTIEDVLERDTVRPTMHRNTEAILATLKVFGEEGSTPQASAGTTLVSATKVEPAKVEPVPEPKPSAPKPGSGWDRIVTELKKHKTGRTALEISTEVGLTKRHTSQLLSEHPAEVVQDSDYRWRLK